MALRKQFPEMNPSDKYQRTRQEILAEFESQEKFLVFYMNQIAGRQFDFYKPLATTFRILFHHHGSNKSLLNQLGIEEKIEMVSTSNHFEPSSIISFLGLIGVRVESNSAFYIPHEMPNAFRTIPFEKWWSSEIVINDSSRKKWTRKELVTFAANQDGGSHVDPRIDLKYYQLAYQNSIGWKFFKGSESEGVGLDNPIPASLWQVGLEFLKSLEIFRKKNSNRI